MLCDENSSEVEVGGVDTVSWPSTVDWELLLDIVVFKASNASLVSSCLFPDRDIFPRLDVEG